MAWSGVMLTHCDLSWIISEKKVIRNQNVLGKSKKPRVQCFGLYHDIYVLD